LTRNTIISNGDGLAYPTNNYIFGISSTGRLTFFGRTPSSQLYSDNNTYALNSCNFVCFVYNGTSVLFYSNGTGQGSVGVTLGTNNTYGVGIGYTMSSSSSHHPFNGSIDEVVIYNRSLSASEVLALYEKQVGGYTNLTTLTEYVNNGTRYYSSNYTLNATNSNYETGSHSYNVSVSLNNLNDVFTLNSSSGSSSTNISNCQNLTVANATYTLVGDIINNTIENDCIIIKSANITLDCLGFSISSIQNYSGVYSNQYNTTVKNCNISMGSGNNTNSIGIEMTNAADYSSIINNTVMGDGMKYGLSTNAEYQLIQDNIVGTSCSNCYGIYFNTALNNTLINNTGTSNSSYGIYLIASSDNNTLINNTGISNLSQGIRLETSSNNTLTNNLGTSNSSIGIYLNTASNNNLTSNTGTSNSNQGIYLSASNNNILSNNTGTSLTGTNNYGI
jgi:parallel beta-helix repeat protein